MYPLSDRFHEVAIQQSPNTVLRVYFIDDTVDCTDDNDVRTNGTLLIGAAGSTDSNGRISMDNGVTFTEYFNPDKNVQMGTAVSSRVSMTLLNYDGALNNWTYGRCKIYLYVYDADYTTWRVCPMGVYIIDDPAKHKTNLVSISGYDQMQKLDAIADTWWAGLNWAGGITLSQLITSLATQVGVSVSSTTASRILNSTVSFTEAPFSCVSVTYREVLEYIAEATGTVARFDRNGALDLKWFVIPTIGGDPVSLETDTAGNRCISVDIAEYSVARVNLLRGKFAEGDLGVTVGSGTNEYTIQNNLLLSGADSTAIRDKLTPIYNRLHAFAPYNPISASFVRYDWSLEAGDVIYIQNNSTSYKFPIFQQTMVWRGGSVSVDLLSDGDAKRPMLDASTRDYYRLDSEMRTITIEADRINLLGYTTINNGFRVNLDGTFEANGATINGDFVSKGRNTNLRDIKTQISNGYFGSSVSINGYDHSMGEMSVYSYPDDMDSYGAAFRVDGSYNGNTSNAYYGHDGIELYKNNTRIFNVAADGSVYSANDIEAADDLKVGGDATVTGSVSAAGTLWANGNANVAGQLSVTGNTFVSGSTTLADASVNGVLSVTNRRSAMLSNVAAGWHRVLEFAPTTASYRLGRAGIVIEFDITRFGTQNETHHVSLSLIETNAKFYGESSNSNTQLIDKIRYTYDSSKGYVDIHLSSAFSANVAVDYQVAASAGSFRGQIKTKSLAEVDDAPSGETVLTNYSFISNTDGDYTFSDKYGKDWHFRKRNGVVYIDAPDAMTPTTNGTNSIGTLPTAFKPKYIVRIAPGNVAGDRKWLYIDTSGGVYAVCYTTVGTSTGFSVTGSYLAVQ